MKAKQLEIIIVTASCSDATTEDERLREAALRAAGRAYAPYSRFSVGAAVLLDDGTIVEGNNQENAAYPSGMCAERVALYYACAAYPSAPVKAVAIVAVQDGKVRKTISPCGACRQALIEAEKRAGTPVRLLLCGRDEIIVVPSVKELLPLSFDTASDA